MWLLGTCKLNFVDDTADLEKSKEAGAQAAWRLAFPSGPEISQALPGWRLACHVDPVGPGGFCGLDALLGAGLDSITLHCCDNELQKDQLRQVLQECPWSTILPELCHQSEKNTPPKLKELALLSVRSQLGALRARDLATVSHPAAPLASVLTYNTMEAVAALLEHSL